MQLTRRHAPVWVALLGIAWAIFRRYRRRRLGGARPAQSAPPQPLAESAEEDVPGDREQEALRFLGIENSPELAVTAMVAFALTLAHAADWVSRLSFVAGMLALCTGLLCARALLTVWAQPSGSAEQVEPRATGSESAEDAAAPARAALEEGLKIADGMDGARWKEEGTVAHMQLSSKDLGSRFPLFRGVLEAPGDELRKLAGGQPPSAAEVFAVSLSSVGRQVADPMTGETRVLRRFGQDAWLSRKAWKSNPVVARQDGVFLEAVRRSRTPSGLSRFTAVVVPAPLELADQFAEEVASLRAGRSYKRSSVRFLLVDVQAREDGGLRVCCAVHAEPELSLIVTASMVRGHLLHVPLRGVAFLDLAMSLSFTKPLRVQGESAKEDFVEVTVGGKPASVSSLLAAVLADQA